MLKKQKQNIKQDNRDFREEIVKISRENEKNWEKIKTEHDKILKELETRCNIKKI